MNHLMLWLMSFFVKIFKLKNFATSQIMHSLILYKKKEKIHSCLTDSLTKLNISIFKYQLYLDSHTAIPGQ